MRVVFVLLAASLWCAQAAADEIDLGFNSDALRVIYTRDLQETKLVLDGGWLHNSEAGDIWHLSMYLPGFASEGSNPIKAGLGGRLAFLNGDLSDQDGYGLGIGGFVEYTLPNIDRVTLTGIAYFAPDILTSGDADKYEDYTATVTYQFMREADVYVGARYVKGHFKGAPNALFDNGMHVGVRVRF